MAPKKSVNRIIVLFEDNPTRKDKYKTKIEDALHGSERVVVFEDEEAAAAPAAPAEAHLLALLKSEKYNRGQIGLIVCDRDLTIYTKGNTQSDRVVSEAAEQLGVPVCLYEERGTAGLLPLATIGRWKRREIVVEASDPFFGKKCAALYQGFEDIRTALKKIAAQQFAKMTPPDILARILDKEEELDRIALYGAGEQDALLELLPYYNQSTSDVSAIRERYHKVLGNWLYSSILRFPGILVNEVAAASYLGIDVKDFRKGPVQNLFKKAYYRGPFADYGKWWWRRELDKIIATKSCETGFEYARKRGKPVKPCQCAEENHPQAGFYCMILEEPVCEKHSRGGISWFPGGADLARISKGQYDKIGPFLGLY
jgi:hypothetical protein